MKRDIVITVAESTNKILQMFSPTERYSGIGGIVATGVSINYPINDVPTARVTVGPEALPLVCNIEKYRRHPVNIRVESINGCLTFDGLLDGVSINQSPGHLSMQLILKHPMQILREINPLWLGYQSGGIDFTKRGQTLNGPFTGDGALGLQYQLGGQVYKFLDKTITSGIIDILRSVIVTQQYWSTLMSDPAKTGGDNTIYDIFKITDALRKSHLPMALALLEGIDTTTYASSYLKLADYQSMNWVFNSICATRTNLFDMLVDMFRTIGCSLITGNNKAFVVPSVGFLKIPHNSDIGYQQFSTTPNVVFPSQYSSLSFSDSGYKDISGVYALSDQSTQLLHSKFIDPNINTAGKGGILGVQAPILLSYNNASVAAAVARLHFGLTAGAANSASAPGAATTEKDMQATVKANAMTEAEKGIQAGIDAAISSDDTTKLLYKFLDNWAELKYYEEKYSDRIGGYSCAFLPNFAPGAIGSIYLRHPGVYIDYYVERVTHDIAVEAPNNGTATTSVGFSCGRMGSVGSALLSSGVDSFLLYEHNAQKSFRYAADFLRSVN